MNHTATTVQTACSAARSLPCGHCASPAGQPCVTRGGQEGYHLARFARARTNKLITAVDLAAAIMAAGPVFTPASVICEATS
jgi:hypothetical protein